MKTPQISAPKLAAALGLKNELWLKREDEHQYGSHKGRSLPLMIAEHHKTGTAHFVISSSGNAALAAGLAIQTHNTNNPADPLDLKIFVGQHIETEKLKRLKQLLTDQRITIEQVEKPKQQALQLEKAGQGIFLRQSADDSALSGYTLLAEELAKIENLAAVFIPTSSGTTAQGLYEGFARLKINPQIHIIQTDVCHPMVNEVHEAEGPSLASAIVDKVARRKEKVLAAIKNSHGNGWIATNDDIRAALKIVEEATSLVISPNSALSIVGLTQAIAAGRSWSGPVVCLITGQ